MKRSGSPKTVQVGGNVSIILLTPPAHPQQFSQAHQSDKYVPLQYPPLSLSVLLQ